MAVVTAVALGAVAAGAAAYAAHEEADAAADAQERNIQNTLVTNSQNEALWRETRGSKGNAFLPLYARTPGGEPFEREMFADTFDVYDAVNSGTAADRIARDRALVDGMAPMQEQALATSKGIYDGTIERGELENAADVAAARNKGVATRKQGWMEALQSTLNEINAAQNRRGFTGDSFGNRMLKTQARRTGFTQSANEQALADLENAQMNAGIKQNAINRRIQNIQLPYALARQRIDMANLPEDAAMDRQARSAGLVKSLFNIGTGNPFQNMPLPTIQPVANTGQIVGQGISSFAGGLSGMGLGGGGGMGGMLGGFMGGGGGGSTFSSSGAGFGGGFSNSSLGSFGSLSSGNPQIGWGGTYY